MNRSNEEIWNETLRTAELLQKTAGTLNAMEEAVSGLRPPTKECFPVSYVSDAQTLTQLLLELKARGAKVL
jgi:hypothetical protein